VIQEWVSVLLELTDEDWCLYAFNRDPLVGRVPPGERMDFCRKAMECGTELARKTRNGHGEASPALMAERMGVKLVYKADEGANSMFANFQEPDTITVYTPNAKATDALIAEHSLHDLVGQVQVVDVLVAHELYHFLEHAMPELYTARKLVSLWKLGPIENRSRILCLEEIGAMSFTRELIGLACSAYIFNVLMLAPANLPKAQKLYERIMRFKAGRPA